jgi:hypothetical protein
MTLSSAMEVLMKFTLQSVPGQFLNGFRDASRPMSEASSEAIRDASSIAKAEGRASIAAAGFSQAWQNALRDRQYPESGEPSIDAAAFIWHKIPYAGIYEDGGTIQGSPLLWIPLRNAPKKIGRYGRMTPKLFREKIGPLFRMKNTAKPILAARIRATRAPAKVSMSALRRGTNPGGRGRIMAVPIFVGIPSRTVQKRFNIREIAERTAGRLGELYLKHLKDE